MLDKLPHLEDDGLLTPEVRAYSERKYALISYYASMFTASMKGKWSLVYIDLFAGSGRGRIKDSSIILPASPLLALGVKNKFDKYIFCEADAQKMEILKIRVERDYPEQKVVFLEGDANKNVGEILKEIKDPELGQKYLSFCMVDPYNFKDFNFDTIKNLSKIFVDFLILIPTFMDAHRNLDHYFKENNINIEKFTGVKFWRNDWLEAEKKGARFGPYLADLFGRSMNKLKFIYKDTSEMVLVLNEKNSPVYHLAFFSRSPLGMGFWNKARKSTDTQMDLF